MRRSSFPATLVAVSLIATAQPVLVSAQGIEPLLQELVVSEAVFSQEKHELQLTVGARSLSRSATFLRTSQFAVEFGITDFWQVDAGLSGFRSRGPASERRAGFDGWSVGSRLTSPALLGGSVLFSASAEIGRGRDPLLDEELETDAEIGVGALWSIPWLAGSQLQVMSSMELGGNDPEHRVALTVPVRAARLVVERGPADAPTFTTARREVWTLGAGAIVSGGFEAVGGVQFRGGNARDVLLKVTYER
jgi:hypothetical protein